MKLISYAMDFASFLMQNLKEKDIDNIKTIILFGSAARGESTEESDVDLFIDVVDPKERNFEKRINKIKDKFYDSSKFKNYWRLLGIKNDINLIVDQIKKWKLGDIIIGNSIVLYEKYPPKLEVGKSRVIFSWKN